MEKFDTLSEYVVWLYAELLDAQIREVPFKYQEQLDALEEWAHSIPRDEYYDDE